MNTVETVASHQLQYDSNLQIIDTISGDVFAADPYSRMKYGDRDCTKQFASGLTDVLVNQLETVAFSEQPPEFLVAYKAVPPACYYLSKYCLQSLNVRRLNEGLEPGRITQVYKSRVAATDYAASSQADRQAELSGIDFSMLGRTLDGPAVILDDIRITGAAEQKILEVVHQANPTRITLGYIAIFDAIQAATSPSVERDLNVSVISGIEDTLPSIGQDNFDLNIRTLKLLLSTENNDLEEYVYQIPARLLEEVVHGAIASGVDFVQQYAQGMKIVTSAARKRGVYERA